MLTAAELEAASRPPERKVWANGLRPGPASKGDQDAPAAVEITARLMVALRRPCTWAQLSELAGCSDATLKRYLRGIEAAVGLIRPGRGGDWTQPKLYRLP